MEFYKFKSSVHTGGGEKRRKDFSLKRQYTKHSMQWQTPASIWSAHKPEDQCA